MPDEVIAVLYGKRLIKPALALNVPLLICAEVLLVSVRPFTVAEVRVSFNALLNIPPVTFPVKVAAPPAIIVLVAET